MQVTAKDFTQEYADKFYRGMRPLWIECDGWRAEFAKAANVGSRQAVYNIQFARIDRTFGTPFDFKAGEFGSSGSKKRPELERFIRELDKRGWKVALPDGRPLTLETALDWCKETNPFHRRG